MFLFRLVFQEQTMIVLSFSDVIADCEAEMKLSVIIGSDDGSSPPNKAVVYWLNAYTGFFWAPREYMMTDEINSRSVLPFHPPNDFDRSVSSA
jgi:hypothetical protein